MQSSKNKNKTVQNCILVIPIFYVLEDPKNEKRIQTIFS